MSYGCPKQVGVDNGSRFARQRITEGGQPGELIALIHRDGRFV